MATPAIYEQDFLFMFIAHILRAPSVVEKVMTVLRPEDLYMDVDRPYQLVYAAASDYYRDHKAMIPYGVLLMDIDARLSGNPSYLAPGDYEKIRREVDIIFRMSPAEMAPDWMLQQIQLLLSDRRLRYGAHQIATAMPENLDELMESLVQTHTQSKISTGERVSGFEPGEENIAPKPRLGTGCNWFDGLTDGVCAEVCGLLGATGSGKTTAAIQLTTEYIRANQKPAAYFTYENAFDPEYKERFYGCMGGIPADRIRGLSWDQYNPDDQEKIRAFNLNYQGLFKPYNMVNSFGGVPELSTILREHEMAGEPLQFLVIDQHQPFVERNMTSRGISRDQLRGEMQRSVDELMQLSTAMDCFILVLHFLSGKASERSPWVKPELTDAAECKGWANYMQNCLCIGKWDDDNIGWMITTKARSGKKKEIIAQLQGENYRIFFEDGHFTEGDRVFNNEITNPTNKDTVSTGRGRPASGVARSADVD